jgi:hypothetical protein
MRSVIFVAVDLLRRCISQRSIIVCANKVWAAQGVHNLPNKDRVEGVAVPEVNTARFVLVMATHDLRGWFVPGTGRPDRCHEKHCRECTAVRCAEGGEEEERAAGLTCNLMFGPHNSQVGRNTGSREAAGWGTGRQQGCTPDNWVSYERQADYHILVGCIEIVIEDTVKDYKA